MKDITAEKIQNLSYTQFVAFVNQWNVPPGSITTVSEWANYSNVNSGSDILEIACTTGFSSRELARKSRCSATGIDICKDSIETAKLNHKMYFSDLDLKYQHIDANEFESDKPFTHIVMGAALGFFENKELIINKIISLFDNEGYLLVSPYYLIDEKLPEELIARAQDVIGIYPTNFDYYTAMKTYKNFEVVYENRKNIVPETKEQMEKYCKDIIERACKVHNIEDNDIYNIMYERMYEIKDVCNELHKYHAYSVLVLRYNKLIYPNRFIELF